MKKTKDFLFIADTIQDNSIVLLDDEFLHATKVLRLAEGDVIYATDGKGCRVEAMVSNIDKNKLVATIINIQKFKQANKLSIAVALPKSPERLSLIIEKLVEFGTSEIIFINTARTEKTSFNANRNLRIAKAALKQSKNLFMPLLHNSLIDFKIMVLESKHFDLLKIAHCGNTIKDKLQFKDNSCSALVMIGPEGDFTPEEIMFAEQNGFKGISLGGNRLRTETAAIHVASVYYQSIS